MATVPAPAGYPFVPRRVEIGGQTMSYVDQSPPGGAADESPTGTPKDAAPVLLVHGNPTWSFYFRSLLRALPAAGYRAIAPDHIGMGLSDKPSAADYPHTLARRVEDFGDFVDSLGLDRPLTLVVHDWGGPIALSWAVTHPERIEKLVVLNTGAFPLPPGKRIPWSLQAARIPVISDIAVRRFGAFSRGAVVMGTARRWLPAEARDGLLAPYDTPAHRVAVHAFVQDIPTGPADPAFAVLTALEDGLPRLADKPTLICWGLKDPVFDEGILDHLVARMPGAEVHRFADAGHYVLEDAAERIVPLVLAHLEAGRDD